MKELDYKTKKFEKRKENIIENGKWDIEQIKLIEKQYSIGKMDSVRYFYSLALNYVNVAEYFYVVDNKVECMKTINSIVDSFEKCIKQLNNGDETLDSTKRNILKKLEVGFFGYFALLSEQDSKLEVVASKESSIIKMLNDVITEDNSDNIQIMQNAIVMRDSELFNKALTSRIKEIRKFNLDNYLCADFISIALMKLACKIGMKVVGNYAELDIGFFKEI